jgi:hypothetical protein
LLDLGGRPDRLLAVVFELQPMALANRRPLDEILVERHWKDRMQHRDQIPDRFRRERRCPIQHRIDMRGPDLAHRQLSEHG